jgi:O-antigen/teichoic acid export membrane protein
MLLRRTTFGNSLLNFLFVLLSILLAHPLLRLWVGEGYAAKALPVLLILAVAQAVRLAGAPYSVMLIATGNQHKGIWSGALEAVVNVTASIWLAHTMGYVGVAWGTLLGAVAGMAALLLYTVPRAQEIPFSRWSLLESGLLRPLLCLAPLGAYTLAYTGGRVRLESAWLAAGLLASGLLSWGLGRTKPSREL